jgi:hypothetical protein
MLMPRVHHAVWDINGLKSPFVARRLGSLYFLTGARWPWVLCYSLCDVVFLFSNIRFLGVIGGVGVKYIDRGEAILQIG